MRTKNITKACDLIDANYELVVDYLEQWRNGGVISDEKKLHSLITKELIDLDDYVELRDGSIYFARKSAWSHSLRKGA